MKIIALALVEIKPVYYPGEEKLVSLHVLKLYRGEDIVQQNAEDLDPELWLDEGELMELPEVGARYQPEEQARHELHPEPDLEIPVIPEDPEEIAVRERIHEKIQAEIYHEDKEAEAAGEEILESPPEWKKVPDLMMEDEDVQQSTEAAVKRKIDEVAQGLRKERR